jgi:hypothetical protein
VRLEGFGQLKKSNYLIGTRTRDLPACTIVPQPTTLPRAPNQIHIHVEIKIATTSGNACYHSVNTVLPSKYSFFRWLSQPNQGLGLLFSSVIIFTNGATPWTRDQPVARPLPKHWTTQRINAYTHQTSIP